MSNINTIINLKNDNGSDIVYIFLRDAKSIGYKDIHSLCRYSELMLRPTTRRFRVLFNYLHKLETN